MESTRRGLYLLLGFLLMVNLVYGSRQFANEVMKAIGYTSEFCYDESSRYLIRFREMTQVHNPTDLWDYMEDLYNARSVNKWFVNAYYTLLYDFQKMYVDCVISINLGMGKRHAPPKR